MITHLHVQLQLPNTEPPVRREVILPDSVLLDDMNLVINICFGWSITDNFEFVTAQTKNSYTGGSLSFLGFKQSLPAVMVTLLFAFQKNRSILYYRSAQPNDCVELTLLNTNSLLPEPTFQLNSWHGENLPCSDSGCYPFQQEQVNDALAALRADLYLTEDEFDFDSMTPLDLLAQMQENGIPEELSQLFDGMPKEDALALLDEWMAQVSNQLTITYTMSQCFSTLSKDGLIDIMRYNHFTGYSKLRRSELEDRLLRELTNPDFLKAQMETLTIPEIELLDFLCRANMPFDTPEAALHAQHLLQSGLCYLDQAEGLLMVPSELRQQYESLLQNEGLIREAQFYDMLHTFCYTAVYLYGVYPIKSLLRRINESMQLTVTEQELREVIVPMQFKRGDYILRDNWIIAAELEPNSPEEQKLLDHLMLQQQQRTELFWPDMDQITAIVFNRRLADEELYRTFAADFTPYLNRDIVLTLALSQLEYMIRSGASLQDIMLFLTSFVFDLPDMETAEQMTASLMTIWNQTPMWSNGGFTPNQMRAKSKKKTGNHKSSAKKNNVVSLQDHRNKKKNL